MATGSTDRRREDHTMQDRKDGALPAGWQTARETRWLMSGPAGVVEVLINGVDNARGIALLCHPHPLYGGSLDNKVVVTLARACRAAGLLAVRFNFRGVGASAGQYDDGAGELADARSLLQQLQAALPDQPLVLGGFSFGAAVVARLAQDTPCAAVLLVAPPVPRYALETVSRLPAPVWLVQADDDEVVDSAQVYAWFRRLAAPRKTLQREPVAGHFFHGRLAPLKSALDDFLAALAL